MYSKILTRWIEKRITVDQILLLVRTGWLTQDQADIIISTEQNA